MLHNLLWGNLRRWNENKKYFDLHLQKGTARESSRWIKSLENSIYVSKYTCICKRHWPPDYKKISVAIWQIATSWSSKHISRSKTAFNSSQTRQTTSYNQKFLRVRNRKDNELKAFQMQDKVSFETLLKRGSYSWVWWENNKLRGLVTPLFCSL